VNGPADGEYALPMMSRSKLEEFEANEEGQTDQEGVKAIEIERTQSDLEGQLRTHA
jgi:hypothetical protein